MFARKNDHYSLVSMNFHARKAGGKHNIIAMHEERAVKSALGR